MGVHTMGGPGGFAGDAVLTGIHRRAVRARMLATLLRVALRSYADPREALRAARAVVATGDRVDPWPERFITHRGRAYGVAERPGFPSLAFERFVAVELNKHARYREGFDLTMALVAITRRCPLRCVHCSEWDSLNQPDPLSVTALCDIVAALQHQGVSHIELTGGEPLTRMDAVEAILRSARPGTDFWVLTSGAPMTEHLASRLARAGVTGVMVSLDHWDGAQHDRFRGTPGTFVRALTAMTLARDAGLLVGASVTATRQTAQRTDLLRIVGEARAHGATFVRVVDPHPAGRWALQDVSLSPAQRAAVASLARDAERVWPTDAPLVRETGLARATDGCQGAGKRYLFIDAAGDVHACPFCRSNVGNCLRDGLGETLRRLRTTRCQADDVPLASLRRSATAVA